MPANNEEVIARADTIETYDSAGHAESHRTLCSGLPPSVKQEHRAETVSVLNALILMIPLISRYRRYYPEQKRMDILNYITHNPGCTMSDIMNNLNMPLGTVRYYVLSLEEDQEVSFNKVGKYLMIFPNRPVVDEKERMMLSFVRNNNSRKILCMILKNDAITNREISEACNMNKSLTHRYLKNLLKNKMILSKKEGKTKRYYINEEYKSFLANRLSCN